jgi:hypothetical protein
MSFKEREPVRSTLVIDNKIAKQVNSFNCVGNLIFYKKEVNVDNTLKNYFKVTCIINIMFKPQKTLKKTGIKLYNTLALPVLIYGSEKWATKA